MQLRKVGITNPANQVKKKKSVSDILLYISLCICVCTFISDFLRIKSVNLKLFYFLRLPGLLAEQTYCAPCSFCCHSLATVKHLEKVSILFAPLILYCVYFLHSYISVKYSKTKNVSLVLFEFINVYTLIKYFFKPALAGTYC